MVLRLPGRARPRPSTQASPPAESLPVLPAHGSDTNQGAHARPARSADFDRAQIRWSKLASHGRGGLALANDHSCQQQQQQPHPIHQQHPADSMESITLADHAPQLETSVHSSSSTIDPVPHVPQCWVRTTSGHSHSESALTTTSPSLPSRPPKPTPRPANTASVSAQFSAPPPAPFASPQSPALSRPSLSDYGSSPGGPINPHKWDYAELTALKHRFNLLDEEGKGWLSRAQFFDLLLSILDSPSDDSADHSSMFNFAYSLFYSSDERLNLKDFVTGMTILSKGSHEERLRYLFMMYDSDGSGYLTAEEIIQVFRIMCSFAKSQDFKASDSVEGHSLANLRKGNSQNLEDLALKALKEHDMDGDGMIGFSDFSRWCSQDPVVKTWLDMLCHGTALGIARLRNEREQALIAQELGSLGFADKAFWRESLALNPASQASSSVLPPTISHELSNIPSSGTRSSDTDSGDIDSIPSHNLNRSPTSQDEPSSSSEDSMSRQRGHNRSLTLNAIGTFEIDFRDLNFEKQIGSGSFATVWRCKWLDSPVAVKVFRWGPRLVLDSNGTPVVPGEPEQTGSHYQEDGESFEPEFDSMMGQYNADPYDEDEGDELANHRVRFLQEVSLLKSIRHPNLLLYMGACVDPRFPLCIVSELIEGGSLFDCLHGTNKITLNLRQKLMLVQNIARGMLYLHGREPIVLHRDLKSANILVSKQNDGNYKATIIDFGLSKLNTTQASLVPGQARGMTGSLVTMAPEVMNEQKYQTGSDVYSFAIVCWEIFCGRIPFGRQPQVTQLLVKVAVRGERPRFLSEDHVPSAVQALIRECWDQDVSKRPDFLAIAKTLNKIIRELGLGEDE